MLVWLLVTIVLGRVEGQGGVNRDGRRGGRLLHLVGHGVLVRVVQGNRLRGVGGGGVVVGELLVGDVVVLVSHRCVRHAGREVRRGCAGTGSGRERLKEEAGELNRTYRFLFLRWWWTARGGAAERAGRGVIVTLGKEKGGGRRREMGELRMRRPIQDLRDCD